MWVCVFVGRSRGRTSNAERAEAVGAMKTLQETARRTGWSEPLPVVPVSGDALPRPLPEQVLGHRRPQGGGLYPPGGAVRLAGSGFRIAPVARRRTKESRAAWEYRAPVFLYFVTFE